MRWNRFTAVGCIVALAASLLLARVHPFGDAGLNAQPHGGRIMNLADISPNVRETLLKES
jgi:cytochrome c